MPARQLVAGVGIAVTLLVTGCGVEPQRTPESVPPARLPTPSPSPSAAAAAISGRVWGARDGRLVPVYTELQGTGTASRVRAVLALDDPDQGLPSALPAGARLLGITRSGDRIELTLSRELREVPTEDLPLALAQLVYTVTERPEVRRVHVRADREPMVYVDARGRRIGRALTRSDFAELVRLEEPDQR